METSITDQATTSNVGTEQRLPSGYDAARMKPRPNRSTEGKANPVGVSVLHLDTTKQNVISEIRPWVGAEVSVTQILAKM